MSTESPRRSWMYRLTIPWIWLITAMISRRNPGDEYGLFVVANRPPLLMAGFLLEHLLPVQWMLVAIIVGGCLSMWPLSWLLDRLRVPVHVFLTSYSLIAVGFLGLVLRQFESYERAIARNGSEWAYLSSASNFALFFSAVLWIAIFAVWRGIQTWRQPPVAS